MRGAGARLAVRGLEAGWDATSVVIGADLEVGAGETVAVLGNNGSGKSSLLWALAGLLKPRDGTVHLDGRLVTGMGAERLAALGLRLLPQSRRVFPTLTVAENLASVELGVGRPDLSAIRTRRGMLLERFGGFGALLDRQAAELSGGEQQLLAVVRVLSTGPGVLLLDEPSAGLSPGRASECGDLFAEAAQQGAAVLLVEQNVALARRLATRTLRMVNGHLSASPAPL